jgi:NTP pyrophosphatase (non-canonical NTP hydrolase)
MTFDDYQSAATRTTNPALSTEQRLLDAAAGLAEEAGEVLGLVRKHLFQEHPLDRERLAKELGDTLWCLTITAATAGLSLDEVARANVEKLRRRYPDGFTGAASRERRDESGGAG